MKVKEESEKAGLKQHSKNYDLGIQSYYFMQINGDNVETVSDLIFLGSKTTADSDCSCEIKTFAPWKKSNDKSRQHIKKQRHY